MTDKKIKNPFIVAAQAAKSAANNSRVPESRSAPVQNARRTNQVTANRPAKKSAGRGR